MPPRTITHHDTTFTEMDVDAVLARAPQVALVDELALTNVPGCRNAKRWQDIQELLDAGITVLSTVNIQHLESLNDVITEITGVVQRETVPDAVVRAADTRSSSFVLQPAQPSAKGRGGWLSRGRPSVARRAMLPFRIS